MPTLKKIFNLLNLQILQHKMLKPSIAQGLRFIPQTPRRYDNLHVLKPITKTVNILQHLIPQSRIKHFINTIK